jgi:hypothetical protein
MPVRSKNAWIASREGRAERRVVKIARDVVSRIALKVDLLNDVVVELPAAVDDGFKRSSSWQGPEAQRHEDLSLQTCRTLTPLSLRAGRIEREVVMKSA